MKEKIVDILSKFANSFDLKDWHGLEETLAESIECDYHDLRGTSESVLKHDYVNIRKKTLNHLKTQHLFNNLEISMDRNQASCRLSAMIFRQDNKGVNFNSHVLYHFYLTEVNKEWKIYKIKQSVLWNEGDPAIHTGVYRS